MDDEVRVRDEMTRVKLKVKVFVCNALINGCCEQSRIRKAKEVFKGMLDWKVRPMGAPGKGE